MLHLPPLILQQEVVQILPERVRLQLPKPAASNHLNKLVLQQT
jgi:hypothetical protein